MQQEVNVLILFKTCSKRALLKKTQVQLFSCFLLGFTCLSFIVRCVEDVACNSSHNIFTITNERFSLYNNRIIDNYYIKH